ncbi:hypothetical protein D3C77_611540 [compost metagenome]
MLKVPFVAVKSPRVNSLGTSLKVNVKVADSPALRAATLLVITTVGTEVSST